MQVIYDALNTSAAVIRRSGGIASVTGPERVSWLQGMVSNDVARLGPGDGCFAAHLNSRGRVLSLMVILADEDTLWIELDQDVASSVAELDKLLIMEDAQVADRSSEWRVLTVVGARARAAVETWSGAPLGLDRPYSHCRAGGARIVRADLGYDLIVGVGEVDSVLGRLSDQGVPVASPELWDLLTLESGLPRYAVDVDEGTTLSELGEKGIDYRKGCYIGQEVVAKIKYLGHVNRHLVGFRMAGSEAPSSGAVVRHNDRDAGTLTRAAWSPGAGSVLGLGYVRLGTEAPGTRVEIVSGDRSMAAEVAALPFLVRTWD